MVEDVGAPRRVWDLPTRLFHWALVVLIIASVATGGEEGWRFAVHVASGHLILLLILFRWIWGLSAARARASAISCGRPARSLPMRGVSCVECRRAPSAITRSAG